MTMTGLASFFNLLSPFLTRGNPLCFFNGKCLKNKRHGPKFGLRRLIGHMARAARQIEQKLLIRKVELRAHVRPPIAPGEFESPDFCSRISLNFRRQVSTLKQRGLETGHRNVCTY